jgi:predicted nucleic acid-binding protein
MAIYLLDTSVIIDLLNGKQNRPNLLTELLLQGNTLACCPINVTEIYAGLRANEEEKTERFLKSLHYYPITWEIARLAGILKRDHSKKGRTIGLADATIAAVAITHHLPLLTDNVKDFTMKELRLYPLPN